VLPHYLVENERSRQQGHVADLYRDAEAHRVVREGNAGTGRGWIDVSRPTGWLGARFVTAVASLRGRFISPCGELVLVRARADC
jgi:hypothetical protein